MKIIEKLSKQIHEEIKDAKKYIECALMEKERNKDLADLYYLLAGEELGHMEKLHAAVVKEISKFKATGKEVPAVMQEIWNWQHGEIIEESTEVRMMIEMYRK